MERENTAAKVPTSVFSASVRPRHCDAQGMLHASRYYEYFEDAFLAWLDDHIGGYEALRATGVDMVVVVSGCEHRRGAALGERLAIEVRPVAAGRTSLSMTFTFRGGAGDVLATGHTTYVAVSADGPVTLPERLRALTEGLPSA
ncbi:acyl-CoA thioesterase [Actinomadura sp. KC345]|uniref:acyl-CoA thioesterase n=1 Tax=Actinomadura sp. KC345 TaxID=2530371 RepID=UPI0026C39BE1